jgi:hypothetical protein
MIRPSRHGRPADRVGRASSLAKEPYSTAEDTEGRRGRRTKNLSCAETPGPGERPVNHGGHGDPSAAFGRNQKGKEAGALPSVLSRTVRRILRDSVIAPRRPRGGDDSTDSRRQSPPYPGPASRPPSRRYFWIVRWSCPTAWHPACRAPAFLPFGRDLSPHGFWHAGQRGIVASSWVFGTRERMLLFLL